MEPQLERLLRAAQEQREQVVGMPERLSQTQFAWRDRPGRWSIAQHLAHLAITNRKYLAAANAAIEEARRGGLLRAGPYRGRLLARFFLAGLGPPVRLRIRTFSELMPTDDPPARGAVEEFARVQDELTAGIRNADGVDLARATMRSPFLRSLRMTALQGLEAVILHNARHLWHIEQLRKQRSFPASGETPEAASGSGADA